MTYCVAITLEAGMIFASDSRTNAGVDQISRFSKMRTFVKPGDRVIVTLSSGNLSMTQNTVNTLEQQARATDGQTNYGTRRRCSRSRACSVTRCAR